MICPQCQHENRRDARFCEACGAALALACPRCGEAVGAKARFCSGCGALVEALPAPPGAGMPPRDTDRPDETVARSAAEVGERRHLSVLFCDLVDSTELAASLDAEEWRDVVQRYQQEAGARVTRFGGHVAQHLGDGLLAYFGWPRAQEDAAERAVRAGLAIVEAVGSMAPAADAGPLRVRVGIHTGPVVVSEIGGAGRAETLAVGETPNVAARVQAAAAPGSVMITAATHRLVSGLFVVEDCGRHALKGVREPVGLQRVVQPSGVRGHLAAAAQHGLTPFVGREHERQLLRDRFEQAREGEGQVVLLVGEAGIGKSRLAQQLREDLAGVPHSWLESAGSPYQAHTPFHAVTDLLGQLFVWQAEEPAEVRVATLGRALEAAGLKAEEAVPLLAPLLDLPVPPGYPPMMAAPELAHRRLLATLAAWTFGVARQQPLVILLEDLHWVDPSTLELQRLLVEQGATLPLLLVYTARPEFRAPWPLRAHHTQLTLNRLSRRQVREMVAQVAVRTALYDEMVEAVVARTDGVPLFVEELTKAVAEAGAGALSQDVPETLEDSLMARLDRLGPEAKELAQVGAVCGREFSFELLAAADGRPPEVLEAALEKLRDAELLYVRGLPPDATYTFKHALVRDAAYQSLLKSRRRELHGRVAATLAEHFPNVAGTQPELLAQHWSEAGEALRSAQAWHEAAVRAAAPGEAERQLRRGLDELALVPAGRARDETELRMQILLGMTLAGVHGYGSPESAAAYLRARALCEGVENPVALLLLLIGLWLSTHAREGPAAAQPLAEQVYAVAERAGLAPWRQWAHLVQGVTCLHLGELAAADEHLSQAQALHDDATALALGGDALVSILVQRALTDWARGHADRSRSHARDAIARAERTGRPSDRVMAQRYAAFLSSHLRDPAAVITHEEALRAVGVALNPREEAQALDLRGWVLAEQGRSAEGIALLREAVERHVALGERLVLERYIGNLAEALFGAGQLEEALGVLAEAEGAVAGPSLFRTDTLRLRAEILAKAGKAPATEVEATFRAALDVAEKQGNRSYGLHAATSFARWLRDQGRAAEGRAVLAPLHATFTEGFDTLDLREAKELLEELS